MATLSPSQEAALVIMPKISGIISSVFSITVISLILRSPTKRSKPYHRVILSLSISDVVLSLSMGFLSTWPLPKNQGYLWAVGTELTCQIQGFFAQLVACVSVYNFGLSIYYLMTIKYGYTEHQMKQKYEIYFHIIPLSWGLITASIGAILGLYGPANLWCWFAKDPTIGPFGIYFYRWVLFYAVSWASFIGVGINLLLIYLHVRKVTLKSQQYVYNNNNNNNNSTHTTTGRTSNASIISTVTTQSNNNNKCQYSKRRKQVAYQCLRYFSAYALINMPLYTSRVLQSFGIQVPFGMMLAGSIGTPLQGLPNFFVYFYPTFLKRKRNNKNKNSENQESSSHNNNNSTASSTIWTRSISSWWRSGGGVGTGGGSSGGHDQSSSIPRFTTSSYSRDYHHQSEHDDDDDDEECNACYGSEEEHNDTGRSSTALHRRSSRFPSIRDLVLIVDDDFDDSDDNDDNGELSQDKNKDEDKEMDEALGGAPEEEESIVMMKVDALLPPKNNGIIMMSGSTDFQEEEEEEEDMEENARAAEAEAAAAIVDLLVEEEVEEEIPNNI